MTARNRLLLALIVLALAAAAYMFWPPRGAQEPMAADVWFVEVAQESGLDFVHTEGPVRRWWFPETVTGGAVLLDYDGDGWLDIYLVQGGDLDPAGEHPGNQLYRNVGGQFTDVTAQAGGGDTGYGMGGTAADYDGDGDIDLYVTNVGANVLYRNDGGKFTDVTAEMGVGDAGWGTSCAFLDADGDGDLDLFVVNYVRWSIATDLECYSGFGARRFCGPNTYQSPTPDILYRNDGTRFTDVTESSGISEFQTNGLGVACGDYDLDGRIDIYVASDGLPNPLWINDGELRFTERGLYSGTAVNSVGKAEAGMGVQAVDADHDGDLDLFLSHLRQETNTFYRNEDGVFDDVTSRIGLGRPSYIYTGFGLGFHDFDHDGGLDIYIANGGVGWTDRPFLPEDRHAEPNILFRSAGDSEFEEVLPLGGTAETLIHTSRAAAFGDLDNDGDVDIVVANRGVAPYLLRNVAGERGHWIGFDVRDRQGRHALHARVELRTAGGKTLWRSVQRDYSYCAGNDPRVHFGLGESTEVESVTVHWNDGTKTAFGPFAAGEYRTLRREP